jgi:hypothetical protein
MFGVDRLIRDEARNLGDRRVGLLTHDAAVTARWPQPVSPSRVALLRAGVRLTVLFAPEHGLDMSASDGTAVPDGRDPLTHLPVRSLYGAGFGPTPEMLDDVDLLLVDLQDIGTRFYTYIWTLSHALEACAAAQVPVWVLDRPNPLGGDLAVAEGRSSTALDAGLAGRWKIPVRHSLTIGDGARVESGATAGCCARGSRPAAPLSQWPHRGFRPADITGDPVARPPPGSGTGLAWKGLTVNEVVGPRGRFVVGAPGWTATPGPRSMHVACPLASPLRVRGPAAMLNVRAVGPRPRGRWGRVQTGRLHCI